MKRYQTALFDLDGTLTDSALGITRSIQYALEKFGIRVTDRTKLYKFIGPPLLDSFMNGYNFSCEKAERACNYYHEYFIEYGMFENKVYDGIPTLLNDLKNNGMITAVASAKPEIFVTQILRHFNLDGYFHFIGGADRKADRPNKEDVIAYVLNALPNVDKRKIVMIGDRQDDIFGAKRNQLDSIGVLYGFGSRAELQAAGADCIIESVDDLRFQLIGA